MSQTPPIPADEQQRLEALDRSNLLNTPQDAVFDQVCRLASEFLDTPMASITLVDANRQWFKSKVGIDLNHVPRQDSFCAHAINDDNGLVVPDTTRDPRFADNPYVTGEPNVRFYAGTPLRTAEGYNLGTLCVVDTVTHPDFGAPRLRTLEHLADIAVAWMRMRDAAGYLDAETGVYTRQRLLETLNGRRRKPDHGADDARDFLAVVDVALPRQIENLIQVMGYRQIEQFTVECIDRLSAAIGRKQELYRIGIFRFAFLMTEHAGSATTRRLDALIETLCEPFDSGVGILLAPSAAIGIIDLDAAGDSTANKLLRRASVAADDACEIQRGWAFYRGDSDARRQRTFRLLADLPTAFTAPDQLYLKYQPKMNLASGACRGVEALLRWTHPVLGTIAPIEVIEAAEKTALMRPLTDWVLDTALAQNAAWRRAGMSLQIAVNLSAHDLADARLVCRVRHALDRHRLPGNSLELEFTESALIRDLDAVIPKLRQLHALGISTAIDDFGTGYCNLTYLQKLHSCKIKIDRRFVQALDNDARNRTLTRAIVDLAHGMGYQVVAEGIETQGAADLLTDWGCEQAQGFLYSRPLRAQKVSGWVTRNASAVRTRSFRDSVHVL